MGLHLLLMSYQLLCKTTQKSSKKQINILHNPEFFYLKSFYLIDEEAHPCLFEMEIENPELLDEIL